eukprot:3590544-Rhodomonas_salina.1
MCIRDSCQLSFHGLQPLQSTPVRSAPINATSQPHLPTLLSACCAHKWEHCTHRGHCIHEWGPRQPKRSENQGELHLRGVRGVARGDICDAFLSRSPSHHHTKTSDLARARKTHTWNLKGRGMERHLAEEGAVLPAPCCAVPLCVAVQPPSQPPLL